MEKEISAQFFLTNLSHEIRTPLNGIVGYTQLLSQTKLDSTQQLYLNSMGQCCTQLIELVNDILDFSKLTSGKVQVNKELFSLTELKDQLIVTLGTRIKEKRQNLNFVFEPDLPKYIIADKYKILQILINLVSNSNKFTEKTGRIIVSFCKKDFDYLEFSVEDNGIGISVENQKKLFNPFFQVQETLIKNGSGLGLAICKKLAEVLGGEIKVESDAGMGSVFSFSFKYEPYETYQNFIEKNLQLLKGKYILVVDDNVDNRLFLSELLFELETIPIICSSGKEALRMIQGKRYQFSICLLDICLGEISGTQLAKEIRLINSELPLLALSSLDSPFDSKDFLYVLQKPIEKNRLIDILAKTLNKNDINQFKLNNIEQKINTKENKILIAEDILYNSEMLIKMLNSMGYNNIETVSNGEDAIEKIKTSFFNILLLDLKMPKKNGIEVASFLKENNYVYPKICVITASVSDLDRDKCKELGINYFLLKPFNMNHLKNIIKNILN